MHPGHKLQQARTRVRLIPDHIYILTLLLQILKSFTELNDFDDPYWVANAFLIIVLKSTSQADQRAKLPKIPKEQRPAKVHKAAKVAKGTPAKKGRKPKPSPRVVHQDPVEELAYNTTMMSINEGKVPPFNSLPY